MGKALAEMLAKRGANLVIVSRNIEKLESALKDIRVPNPSLKGSETSY